MPKRLRVYIAGPYTAADEESVHKNVTAAIDAGIEVYKRGHYPLIPHLTHFVELRSIETQAGLSWEDYLAWDRAWLTQCDAFLLLAPSRGASLELGWAEKARLKVFRSLDEIPRLAEPHLDDTLLAELPPSASEKAAHKA